MRAYPFISSYLQDSGWELTSAVLVRIQSDHAPSVWAGAASFPFDTTLETETSLGKESCFLDVGRRRLVGACVSENG